MKNEKMVTPIPNTPLNSHLTEMARHPEYEAMLDKPGLAYHFNEFIKGALALEKLVLDHFAYKNAQSAVREVNRQRRKKNPRLAR